MKKNRLNRNLYCLLACLLGYFLVGTASAQTIDYQPKTSFLQLKKKAEDARTQLDRARVKALGYQIKQLGEEVQSQQFIQWGNYFVAEGLTREAPAEAKSFADKALSYFEEKESAWNTGYLYNVLGSIYANLNLIDSSLYFYHRAIEYIEYAPPTAEKKLTKRRITAALYNIGFTYSRQSAFERAADYLFMAQENAQELRDTLLLTNIINSIGNTFFLAGQYEQSHNYYLHAYELALNYQHQKSLRLTLSSLATNFFAKQQYDSALHFAQQGIELLEPEIDQVSYCIAFSNLANIYATMGNIQKADSINFLIADVARRKQLPRYLATAYFNIAELALKSENYSKVLKYAHLALEIIGDSNNLDFKRSIYQLLSSTFENIHEYDKALVHYQKFKALSDSLLNEKSLAKIQELETRYKTQKKEQEINQLAEINRHQAQKHRQTIGRLIGGLLVVSLLVAILFLKNRQRVLVATNQTLEIEQRFLRSQMNPHFVFNTLASIQSYLLREGQQQKGILYLAKFAKLFRRILENSRMSFVPLSDELETLEHYLALQQLRYHKMFDYEIRVAPDLETEQIMFPSMIMQPAVENAIQHGQLSEVPQAKILVEIKLQEKDFLRVSIEDNGVGFKAPRQNVPYKEGYQSLGSKITEERIQILKKTHHPKVACQILESQGRGTVIIIDFPIKPHHK